MSEPLAIGINNRGYNGEKKGNEGFNDGQNELDDLLKEILF